MYQRLLHSLEMEVRFLLKGLTKSYSRTYLEDSCDAAREVLQNRYVEATSKGTAEALDKFYSLNNLKYRRLAYKHRIIDALRRRYHGVKSERGGSPEILRDPHGLFFKHLAEQPDNLDEKEKEETRLNEQAKILFQGIDSLQYVCRAVAGGGIRKIEITEKKREQFRKVLRGYLDGKDSKGIARETGMSRSLIGVIYLELGATLVDHGIISEWPSLPKLVDRKKYE